jgi:putative RNA 2'-phosphotransferase
MLSEPLRVQLSKFLAYLLRHDRGLPRTHDGWSKISDVLKLLRRRYPWVTPKHLLDVVKSDDKQRYEIRDGMIRARYGHSVEVALDFPEADVCVLYHGTTEQATRQILRDGLKPMGRKMVHLSATVAAAVEVGKRKTKTPVILKIDVNKARQRGIRILRASKTVYLTSYVPPECISILEGSHES